MNTSKHSSWGDFFADMRAHPIYYTWLTLTTLLVGILVGMGGYALFR